MKLGDHLWFDRGPYDHHAIYIGNGQVIHFAAPEGQDFEAAVLIGRESAVNIVHQAPLERVSEAKPFTVVDWNPDDCYPPLKVVARAQSQLGQAHYTLYQNNCEHFARWCKAGRHESLQVERMREKAAKVVDVAARIAPVLAERVRQEIGATSDSPAASVYDEFAQHVAGLWATHGAALKSRLRYAGPDRRPPAGAVPPGKDDQPVLLEYRGALLWGRSKTDWFVTERAVVWPGGELYLSCHDIAAIKADRRGLVLTDLDDRQHRLPMAFLHPESVAAFLTAAIAGTQPDRPLQAPGLARWLADLWQRG